MHKRILSILLLLVFIFTLSGCSLFASQGTAKAKKMPTDTEVLKEVTKDKIDSTVTKENEDQLELKHLKNAAPVEEKKSKPAASPVADEQGTGDKAVSATEQPVPVTAPVPYVPDYNIHFLNEDEASMISDKLIKLGYLKAPAKDNKEFTDAVYRFQQDEKICCSGKINPETFERLRSK